MMLSLVYCPREIVTAHCLQVALSGGDEDGRLLGISSHQACVYFSPIQYM